MPRPARGFQGRRHRTPRAPPSGPVEWGEVEEWERPADGEGPNVSPTAERNDDAGSVRCTPWRDRAELLAVRGLLYAQADGDGEEHGSVAKKRRLGVSTVELWRRRAPRLLPRAVLATAQLVDAVELRAAARRARTRGADADDDGVEGAIVASPFAVRAVYAAAVAGLVVAFCDSRATAGDGGQLWSLHWEEEPEDYFGDSLLPDLSETTDEDEGPASLPPPPAERAATAHGSMYAAARAVGMPPAWVELRHEIAHGAGPEAIAEPSLKRLHACAEEALEWLWKRYWRLLDQIPEAPARVEAEHPRDIDDSERSDLLKELLRARKLDMRQGGSAEGDKVIQAIIDAHDAPDGLAQVTKLANAFVQDRRLLPRTDAESLDMRVALAIWEPPLQQLCNACPQLYSALVRALFRTLYEMPGETICANGPGDDSDNDYGDVEKQATVQWLRRMLHSDEWTCVRKRCLDFDHSTDLVWELMNECMANPLPATLRFCEYLLRSTDEETRDYWGKFYMAARGPKWKWRRQGRDVVEDEIEESDEPAVAMQRKRPLEDEDGPGKEDDRAGDATKHRKVESVQMTAWAVPIGEVPATRTVTIANIGDV